MYTHAYSQYVNHILNKSPSKTTYTFARAERFQPSKPEHVIQQPYLQTNEFQYRDGAKRYAHFINQAQEVNFEKQKNHKQNNRLARQYNEQARRIFEDNSRKNGAFSRSKSKSPFRPHHHLAARQDIRYIDNREQHKIDEISPNYQAYQPFSSKTPTKQTKRATYSPSKTYTQQLYEMDHVSKNITISGYYPTGQQMTPDGKYPISKIRNPPTYKFGSSPPKQRYTYIVKSEDTLGPGYYDQFSEFGPIKK